MLWCAMLQDMLEIDGFLGDEELDAKKAVFTSQITGAERAVYLADMHKGEPPLVLVAAFQGKFACFSSSPRPASEHTGKKFYQETNVHDYLVPLPSKEEFKDLLKCIHTAENRAIVKEKDFEKFYYWFGPILRAWVKPEAAKIMSLAFKQLGDEPSLARLST